MSAMSDPLPPARRPAPLVHAAAALARPVAILATVLIGALLVLFGAIKFLPAAAPAATTPSVDLLALATGGVIASPIGAWLVGVVQIAIGLGLIVPAARALAGFAALIAAVAVVIGLVVHAGDLNLSGGLSPAATSLIALAVLLVAGGAAGLGHAARVIADPRPKR
jgi:hypothetical protein